MFTNRRSFLSGIFAGLAAPAILRLPLESVPRGIIMPNRWSVNDNKLVVFRKEVVREYIRNNLFTPYCSSEITAIVRVIDQGREMVLKSA